MPFVCKTCNIHFAGDFELKEHSNHHTRETPFMCSNCGTQFSKIKEYVNHALKYPHNHYFPCEQCTDVLMDVKLLHLHKCAVGSNGGQTNRSTGQKLTTYLLPKEQNIQIKRKKQDRPSQLLKCAGCGRKFKSFKLLREHVKRFPEMHYYSCNWCKKVYTSQDKLEKHLCLAEANAEPFKCSCLEEFFSNSLFRKHIGEKPYSCCDCQMEFANVTNLVRHIRTHTHQKPFVCKDCGRGFTQATNLRNHVTIHLGVNAVKCLLCQFSCKTRVGLFKHMKKHEEGMELRDRRKISSKILTCDKCSKEFRFSRNLAMHMKTHESGDVLCSNCGKMFINTRRLAIHIRASHGEKCICSECGKVFASAALLQSHSKIHVTHKEFSCTICLKTFATRNYLLQHSKTHTAIKPYSCTLCGKQFKVVASLKYHNKVSCIKIDL